MTQAPALETMQLQIVSCETCDALFLVSPRRQSCPTCGGPPGVEFFTFDVGPEGVQLRDSLTDVSSLTPPAPPVSEPPATDELGVPEAPGETFDFGAHCPACDVALKVSVTNDVCAVELAAAPPSAPEAEPEMSTTTEPEPAEA